MARALAYGSHDITGVEINPIIAETVMQEHFPQFSQNCVAGIRIERVKLHHRPQAPRNRGLNGNGNSQFIAG